MCGRMRTMWPMSEVMGWPRAETNAAPGETGPASPADVLIEHLGIVQRSSAEVQDLYSNPIPAPVVTLVPVVTFLPKDSVLERQHPARAPEPDLDAA